MIYGMRILPAYIRNSFAVTFLMTLLMVTFVICVMALFRLSDLLAGGGSGTLIFKIFAYSMPEAFSFSIPISLMTAALLTFGKFSANGEITAMKACGISMWQIARPPLMIATLMSMVCLILNADLNPNAKLAQRNALRRLGMENPLEAVVDKPWIFHGHKVMWMSSQIAAMIIVGVLLAIPLASAGWTLARDLIALRHARHAEWDAADERVTVTAHEHEHAAQSDATAPCE